MNSRISLLSPFPLLCLVLSVIWSPSPVLAAEADSGLARRLADQRHTDDLPGIRKRGVIRLLVAYGRTDFFFNDDGTPQGLQVAYAEQYEKHLNAGIKDVTRKTRIEYIPTTFDRLLDDLEAGRGDIAADMLTITPGRQKRVAFATGGAMKVDELVVVHKDVAGIDKVEDLAGREVYVLKGSSYVEHLRDLNARFAAEGRKPVTVVEADSHLHSDGILEMVNAGAVGITVMDDFEARLWAKVLPDVRVLDGVKVSAGNRIGWAVRKDNPELLKDLNAMARKVKKGTLMGNMLFKRYYENTQWIKNPLSDEARARLKALLGLFRKYAGQFGFDTLAVVAQAYQESKLDHGAKSHVGAVGIMQLLPSTAADTNVGIRDINAVEDNIHAGVKYLAFLRERYFNDPQIKEEDRVAFVWAAYNAGPAKVRRMRETAAEMGLDPNVWFNNVEMAAGKLVGRETVHYVGNIFKYYVAYSLVKDRLKIVSEE
jgi:membrane-bound lytic murein transglycosylase MltF